MPSAASATGDPDISGFSSVYEACFVSDLSFDRRVDALIRQGWTIADAAQRARAIEVIGDARAVRELISPGEPPVSETSRNNARSAIGTRINRKSSTYFRSATLVRGSAGGQEFVNLFWNRRRAGVHCAYGSPDGEAGAWFFTEFLGQSLSGGFDLAVSARIEGKPTKGPDGLLESVGFFALTNRERVEAALADRLEGVAALTIITRPAW